MSSSLYIHLAPNWPVHQHQIHQALPFVSRQGLFRLAFNEGGAFLTKSVLFPKFGDGAVVSFNRKCDVMLAHLRENDRTAATAGLDRHLERAPPQET
jgi:hypothetical protein